MNDSIRLIISNIAEDNRAAINWMLSNTIETSYCVNNDTIYMYVSDLALFNETKTIVEDLVKNNEIEYHSFLTEFNINIVVRYSKDFNSFYFKGRSVNIFVIEESNSDYEENKLEERFKKLNENNKLDELNNVKRLTSVTLINEKTEVLK